MRNRLFAAVATALTLAASAASIAGAHRAPKDDAVDQTLMARASSMLGVDPSPAEVKAALEAAGASAVNVGRPVSGTTVGETVDATHERASKDDAALTINEEAMRALDATPTPDEIEQALVDAGATDVSVSAMAADDARGVLSKDVPSNSFSVSSLWADYTGSSGKKHVVFYGFWNFRDDYINGSNPGDASGMQLDGFSANCWTKVSADVVVKDYRGDSHGHGTMDTDTHQKSIFAIDDRTEDFTMLTDNGIHAVDMRRDETGCDQRRAGSYYYEHNQDGGGGWSASISMAIFSLSYSGDSGSTLQKAATYNYYN